MTALILALVLAQQQELPKAPEGLRVREVAKLGIPDVTVQPSAGTPTIAGMRALSRK